MSQSPFEQTGTLRVGTVDFVSPDEIRIILDVEAPQSVALNAGEPRPFPRVNGYLLIPVDDALLVGQVEWTTVERSPFPKRRGMQDFGLVDLPYPLRKLRLNPLGTLRINSANGELHHAFVRGADALPSVGTAVLFPTERQLRAIVESGRHRHVKIGTSPLAGNAEVYVNPNRLFGRHLAVLGNTGSGKSCSVAGLIRWSLEQAMQECSGNPNARFIILDPNGEYSQAFGSDDIARARVFSVNPARCEIALRVPLWFWNSGEWSSFTQASVRTQRPLLRRTLREVKAGRSALQTEATEEEKKLALRRYLSSVLITIQGDMRSGAIRTDETKFGFRLKAIEADLEAKVPEFPNNHLQDVREAIQQTCKATLKTFIKNGEKIEYFRAFSENQIRLIVENLNRSIDSLGGIIYQEGPDEDVPLQFRGSDLADHLEVLAKQENVSQYLDFLVSRIRTFLSEPVLKQIIDDADGPDLSDWLNGYIGPDDRKSPCVSVIDLSLVPTEVVHVVTAVIARMVLEALQRYLKMKGNALPTVLVMEEAHTFVKRYRDDVENVDAATVCCQVFERIAREGRKFGLGMVLSSQRPSELSPTVLSQCNTFLLHRISNDRDQDLVRRFVPDSLRGILRELPTLPTQNAILLGWAVQLPVLVNMNELPEPQRPRSEDPNFWNVWTRKTKREVDWCEIAKGWTQKANEKDPSDRTEERLPRDDEEI